jgi:hypothetical protein
VRWRHLGLCFLLFPSLARADGGTIRLSERIGAYHITVFTAPTPLRAGPVDISVLVQDAATDKPLPEARVTIQLTAVALSGQPTLSQGKDGGAGLIRCPATIEAATNKLFHSAKFELPAAGSWHVEVELEAGQGLERSSFTVEAVEQLPRWVEMWPWIAWPAVVIILFAIRQVFVWRARGARSQGTGIRSQRGNGLLPPDP